jgi:hypothetical protein
MADTRKHSAGKGDKYRPVDRTKYVSNYDDIKWPSREKNVDRQKKLK